jgi:uracil-DNA glycosylase family 4
MTVTIDVQAAVAEPPRDCPLCPRLVEFRDANRRGHPDWYNGAVPSFGAETARLLVAGLAPGLKGANRTGRPFLGDFAGDLLYPSLIKAGLAKGRHDPAHPEALQLIDCMISNAVRCVPPANRPTGPEIATCRQFLIGRIASLPNLQTILALGRIAHDSTLEALGLKRRPYPFAHGARHKLECGLVLFDSYHCSRQNTNTGRLTPAMFEAVLAVIAGDLRLS